MSIKPDRTAGIIADTRAQLTGCSNMPKRTVHASNGRVSSLARLSRRKSGIGAADGRLSAVAGHVPLTCGRPHKPPLLLGGGPHLARGWA